MSDNHDLLNDKDVCSFEEHEAENVCSNKDAVAYRKRLPADAGKLNPILFLFTEEGGFFIAFFALFFTSRLCETTEMVYRKRSNERGEKKWREKALSSTAAFTIPSRA